MNLFVYFTYWNSLITGYSDYLSRVSRALLFFFATNFLETAVCIHRKTPGKRLTFALHWCNSLNFFPFLEHHKPECHPCVYRKLNEAYRYWNHTNHPYLGYDKDKLTNGQWYRFTGRAGVMMANYCIPHLSCNAHMAGWINGSHPMRTYQLVSTTVCFHWNQNCCYISYPVEIMKCKTFYVYKLQKPGDSRARHCSVKGKSCSSIIIFSSN